MGNTCGSDAYGSIVGQYGSMFSQMVMAEQAKNSISQYFTQNRNQTQSFFNNYQTQTFQQMDQGMGAFQNQFSGIQQTLASKLPGGLQSFVPNGQSFAEVVGYSKVVNQIQGLKSNTQSQISRQLAQATSDMNNMQSLTLAKINQSKPVIPQFDKLAPSLQKSLLERAMKQYSPEIKGNNQAIFDQISPILANNMANYKTQLTGINPLQQMTGIIGNFQSGFGNNLQGLIPNNLLGSLNLSSMLGGFNLGGLGLGNLGNMGNIAGMAGGLTNGLGGITNGLGGMANNITSEINGMSNGLANGVNNGLNTGINGINNGLNTGINGINNGIGGVSNNFQQMGNMTQNGINSFGNTMSSTANNTIQGMNRIF